MFPEIHLSDSIVLPTYIVFLSLLYCFLLVYVVRRAVKQEKPIEIALNLALILMIGGFVGGRLFHVFYELPQYYAEDWTRVFKFWEGGFVFFGGFIIALAASWIYVWKMKLSFLEWANFYAPVGALGYGLGRISCFLAGCCYGGSCAAPWAVTFPWDANQIARHPVQLYAVFWELIVFLILIWLEKKNQLKNRIFFLWLIGHSLGRMMMEHYREDFRGNLIWNLSISTWISLILLAIGIASLASTFIFQRRH